MKFVITLCFFTILAFFFQCGERRGTYELNSGKKIEVYDVSQIVKGEKRDIKLLSINYQTNILNNPDLLQLEAEQVWNDIFKQEAEKSNNNLGILRAYPYDGSNILIYRVTVFTFQRRNTGDWYLRNVSTQNK